ncbi:MAG: YjbF family lipoprotein [Pseudoalteromonas distincta]
MNNLLRMGALTLICSSAVGCNSMTANAYDTLRIAVQGPESQVSTGTINRLGQPALVVQLGQSEALMVQASASSSRAEWHGSHQMMVTRQGRVVQTAGMPEASDVIAPLLEDDPFLGDLRALAERTEVTRLVDMPKLYLSALPQHARYTRGPVQEREIMGELITLQRIDERISIPAISFSATNQYWVDPATGAVLASVQHISPELAPLVITHVKPNTDQAAMQP